MDTLTITNERLNIFVIAGKAYLNATAKSKLWFAVDKITKVAVKKLKKVEKLREEKRREFAMKKDKGVYDLTENGGWQFDESGHKKLIEALEEIAKQDCELPIHIIPEGQYDEKDLTYDLRDNFEGIVIPAIDYDNFDIDSWVDPAKKKKEEEEEAKKRTMFSKDVNEVLKKMIPTS